MYDSADLKWFSLKVIETKRVIHVTVKLNEAVPIHALIDPPPPPQKKKTIRNQFALSPVCTHLRTFWVLTWAYSHSGISLPLSSLLHCAARHGSVRPPSATAHKQLRRFYSKLYGLEMWKRWICPWGNFSTEQKKKRKKRELSQILCSSFCKKKHIPGHSLCSLSVSKSICLLSLLRLQIIGRVSSSMWSCRH